MAEEVTKAKDSKKTEADKTAKCSNKKGLIIGCIIAAVVVIAAIIALIVINPFKKASMVGKYDLTGMTSNGEDQSEALSALKAFGIDAELEVYDDKSGAINIFGQDSKFTYDNNKFYFENSISEDDEDVEEDDSINREAEYSFKDNKITIKAEDEEMVFTKKSE